MIERKRIGAKPKAEAGVYFGPDPSACLPSGCTLLDCVLGGGWRIGRIANVVGDRSTGKTLLAIEACANFARRFPGRPIRYVETESAFDPAYAHHLGLPETDVELVSDSVDTVEQLFTDLDKFLDTVATTGPALYIVDSLDAINSQAELDADFGQASFGTGKAKDLSKLFRLVVRKLHKSQCAVIIISQVRDKIGVRFGEKHTRSGGRALDFYASHVLWLTQLSKIKQTRNKVDRIVGVNIKALAKKNKVGPPYRDCEFPILFSFGVDDLRASIAWLEKVGGLEAVGIPKKGGEAAVRAAMQEDQEYKRLSRVLRKEVKAQWRQIEQSFSPTRRKY